MELKSLIRLLGDDQFMNLRDADGNTILHLAAIDRQTKTINFLTNKGVDPNVTNSRGVTALALLTQGKSKVRASGILDSAHQVLQIRNPPVSATREGEREGHEAMMVVAVSLAAMAFQVGLTPPGDLSQDDFDSGGESSGDYIMTQRYPNQYRLLDAYNTSSSNRQSESTISSMTPRRNRGKRISFIG